MSGILLFGSGLVVLAIAIYDFLYTTISLAGLGPVSERLTQGLWRAGRLVTLQTERHLGRSPRGLIGPAIVSTLAATWIALFLAGYVLLYLSGSSLQASETDAPATFVQIVAYAGSTLSTLGASTVEPTNGWWDILSMIAAINGMVVLTLSVTFVLNILQTVMSSRSFAIRYNALLESADARGADRTPDRVASLGTDLCNLAVKLTSSPLTGFFVPDDPSMSFPNTISHLCDLMEQKELTSWSHAIEGDELAALRTGLGQLGRRLKGHGDGGDFAGARAWADHHSLRPGKRP
jgi:hypothetical protein